MNHLPAPVQRTMATLQASGFQAFLVGGCVRDHLLGRQPKDYDIATDATPEQVAPLFPHVIPTGIRYGTVTVVDELMPIEVTTFRADGTYSDGRRPDNVTYSKQIEEDLSRRDFTVNAMAWSPIRGLVDPFGGNRDLNHKLLRVVGNPDERFREDALRMLRAVRLAVQLRFIIDQETFDAIRRNHHLVRNVAMERIREEFNRILLSDHPTKGICALHDTILLSWFLLELCRCYGFDQYNPHHAFPVYYHTLAVVEALPPVLHLRLAGLLHDIAKPYTFTQDEKGTGHFYGHEEKGAEMAAEILERLRYDTETTRNVCLLVREHMFPEEMGPKAIRRFIARVGAEHVPDLLTLRLADIEGSGKPHDTSHVERIQAALAEMQAEGVANPRAALAVNGHDVMVELGLKPGPEVGRILNELAERILDDPGLNEQERLLRLIREMAPVAQRKE